jgi:hypothetical protein
MFAPADLDWATTLQHLQLNQVTVHPPWMFDVVKPSMLCSREFADRNSHMERVVVISGSSGHLQGKHSNRSADPERYMMSGALMPFIACRGLV